MNCKLIKEMIIYDTPKYIKQKVINQIIANGIGTYKTKSEPELIQLKNKAMNEKILECLSKEPATIKVIDLVEISRGYKNLGVFDYTSFNIEKLKDKCKCIESDYYKEISSESEELQTLYLEDTDKVYIKFHYKIKILQKEPALSYFDVRYPILFVLHKKLGILEIRFDKVHVEGHKNYYKYCMNDGLNWLSKNCGLKYKHINLDEIIRAILESNDNIARDLIWAGELKNSQGITIKAGTNMETFFDDLKDHISTLNREYAESDKAVECLSKVSDFLDLTLDLADDKHRTIRWNKYKNSGKYIELDEYIDFKITFNYHGSMLDIINIYDSENNDMERIEYVTRIIGEFRKDFRRISI